MRRYSLTVLLVWIVGAVAASVYAQQRDIPASVAVPVALAMLVELALYAGLAFVDVRGRWEQLGTRLPPALAASALLPYLLYAVPLGEFRVSAVVLLAAAAAVAGGWFLVLPRSRIADLCFLLFMAAVYMTDLFVYVYPPPVEQLDIEILGQLMWIRVGIASLLLVRRAKGTGFGFWPTSREWVIGLREYAFFLPLGALLIYVTGFARLAPSEAAWWQPPLTFFGILWVVALGEELFFRGLLLRWLAESLGTIPGLIITSIAFGVVHLPFREFPNWEFAALAAVAGFFYGRAFLAGNGIRAAMVTHALVVTTWRTFYS